MAYDQATMAKIAALQSAMFAYSPVTYGSDRGGTSSGGKRIASDTDIAKLSNDLWATPGIDRAAVTEQYLTHKQNWLSKFDSNVLTPAIEAVVATGIGAGVAGVAGVGPAAAGGGGGAGALTADQALAQSAAGLSVTGPAETASLLGVGEASAIGAGTAVAAAPTTTTAGSAGVGAGTDAGNAAAAAAGPSSAAAPTAGARALSLAKTIGEFGSSAMTIGSLISGGSGGVDMPSPDAPTPMQPAKDPDYAGIRQKVPGGLSSGNLSTLLTGASGIDPATLMLGKSLLLGS